MMEKRKQHVNVNMKKKNSHCLFSKYKHRACKNDLM